MQWVILTQSEDVQSLSRVCVCVPAHLRTEGGEGMLLSPGSQSLEVLSAQDSIGLAACHFVECMAQIVTWGP